MIDRFYSLYSKKIFSSEHKKMAWYIISYGLYTAIAGSFDIAYTLRITGSFTKLSLFYLFYYLCLALSYIASTFMVTSGRFSRGFRLNLFFQASIGFLMFFAIPSEQRSLVLVPYFMLKGLSEGFYWSSRHAALNCLTKNEGRDRFLLSLQVGTILVSVSMPFLSGLFLRYNTIDVGYSGIYIAGACAALFSLVFGPSIVADPPEKPQLKKLVVFIRDKNNTSWLRYIFFSATNGTLAVFASAILNFGVLKTEFKLGAFTSIVSLCSAIFMLIMRQKIKQGTSKRVLFVGLGSIGDFIGRFVYTLLLSIHGLVVKAFCDSFLVPLRTIFSENILRHRSDIMVVSKQWSVLEPFLFQEICILFARIVAFSASTLLFSFIKIGPYAAARIILFVVAFAQLIDFLFIRKIEKENLHRMT